MSNPKIICIDDQRDVLAALQKDLKPFEEYFEILLCESAQEAEELLQELDANGDATALLICDHVMPNKNGIDFLIELKKEQHFSAIPTILLTGLATHKDTIEAINKANIDRYIEKPWTPDELFKNVSELVTRSILRSGFDYKKLTPVLDQEVLLKELRHRAFDL